MSFFPLITGLLALGRRQEHGPQTGGALHQRATRGRDGFMSKQQVRDLQACTAFIKAQQQLFNGLLPTGESVNFAEPFAPSRIEVEPGFVSDIIHRAENFAVGAPKYSLTARPGWLVVQAPRDGVQRTVFQVPFAPVTGRKTWVIPFFTDLPQNVLGSPNIYGSAGFSIGLTDGGAIDGDNLVNVQISQYGGYGTNPENAWAIDLNVVEGGTSTYGEPSKIVCGAPPVAVVFVKGTDRWHIELLTADGHAAHVSAEFVCNLQPDRFATSVSTNALASHAIVRGYQGLYAFDTDELVL